MTPSRGLALFALTTATAVPVLTAAPVVTAAPVMASAEATAGAVSGDSIRYAWVRGCARRNLTVPCGAVTLTLRDGRTVTLADARVHPRRADGKVDRNDAAPLAVSGDGRYVSYLRGDRLVIRDVDRGTVRPLPGGADVLPRGVGQDDVDATLSSGGTLAVIDYGGKAPALIVNLGNGRTTRVAAKTSVLTMSPDGRHLLTRRDTEGNTADLTVLDANGGKVRTQSVPLALFEGAHVALADDANTLAILDTIIPIKPGLRVYDMAAGPFVTKVPFGSARTLRLPKGERPQRLSWDTNGTLTLWTGRGDKRDGSFVSFVKRAVDPGTATTRRLDSFTVKKSSWTWHLPGE
ncbi:hypothetical protein ACFYY8_11475 [Streptosporangium sp. NPDC001559]|uniref:hypothetical protein n=1 Tax=Streptosporangium sp. NPDC001559 TaxID=3366187 RepID=UPI0036E86E30